MPHGKPAFTPCVNLDSERNCRLFGLPERPAVCSSIQPQDDMCGDSAEEAERLLSELERLTAPAKKILLLLILCSAAVLSAGLPEPPSMKEKGLAFDNAASETCSRSRRCLNNSRYYFSVAFRILRADTEAAKREAAARAKTAAGTLRKEASGAYESAKKKAAEEYGAARDKFKK